MKTLFAFVVFLSFGAWIALSYIPARNVWNSTGRNFISQLIMFLPYFALGLWAVFDSSRWIPRMQRRATLFPWQTDFHDSRRTFNACGFVVTVLMAFFGLFHIYIASESNQGWAFARSPCGASSCSSEPGRSDVVFHPLGWYIAHLNPGPDVWPTICVYEDCEWASSNGLPAQGYNRISAELNPGGIYPDFDAPCTPESVDDPSCDDLATNRTIDSPNKATGFADGLFVGFSISKAHNLALCNHVDAVFFNDTLGVERFGRGQVVCPYCYSYWSDNYPNWVPPRSMAHCAYDAAAAGNYLHCGVICPSPVEIRTPRVLADLVVYWYLAAALPLMSFVAQELLGWTWRNTLPKQKQS